MNKNNEKRNSSCLLTALLLLAVLVVVCLGISSYRPDRPIKRIEPASSGPAFVAQVIRPRAGLPLGGMLPPELFGVDAHLGFDSTVAGAAYRLADGKIELNADDWVLKLSFDSVGQVTIETEVVFELVFEDRVRAVRCQPDDPAVGTVEIIELSGSGEISGHFEIELAHCEDAETGKPLGWPPKPFILHGSFDRLRPNDQSE